MHARAPALGLKAIYAVPINGRGFSDLDTVAGMLVLKVICAGVLASLVVLAANTGSHRLAGLLISFPAVLLSSTLVIGATAGQEAVLSVVRANIVALPVWLITVAGIYLAARYIPWLHGSFVIGVGIWLVAAGAWLWWQGSS